MDKKYVWFEIGKISNGKDGFSKGETYTIYRANSLSECLAEWKDRQYNTKDTFIDIWEGKNGHALPIGQVKLTDKIIANL